MAALVILGIAAVVHSQASQLFSPLAVKLPTSVPEVEAKPEDQHNPVYIRLGVIVDIGADYIIIESKKLKGQGNERISVLFNSDTKIIEIQIPSFMNEALRKKLTAGGDVIPRPEVGRDSLYLGQTVEVVSTEDMYGYKDVVASRVEYKIIVNTEDI